MTQADIPPMTASGRLAALARALGAGAICGFLAVIQSTGFGLFVLGGSTHALSHVVVGMAVFATAAATVVAVLTSSVPGTVSIAQTVPIAALAPGFAYLLDGTGDEAVTMVAFAALASLAFGLCTLGLGAFRWGRLMRFVPYSVMAGFLAGAGWLIMLGGIGVALGHRLTLGHLDVLGEGPLQARLLATLAIVAAIAILVRRYPPSVVLPGVAAVALAIYGIVAAALGFEPAAASASGWLVNLSDAGGLWPPVSLADLGQVDWRAIPGALSAVPVMIVLGTVTMVMNVSTVELATRSDVDLDQEFRSVGLQNVLAGAGGGLPAFHSVPLTLLSGRLRATGPVVGLTAAAVCIAVLTFGDIFLSNVPTPLLGGLVVWVGLSLVIDWLFRAFPRLPRPEFAVVVLIFAVIAIAGLAWGLAVGLVAAAILFVVEYSRIEIVRTVMTGADYQSARDTSEPRRRALRGSGDAILIVRLQGFLFFGTADRMRRRMRHAIENPVGRSIRFLVIDFRRVSGLDSSTAVSFVQLAQASGPSLFTLVCCGMSPAVRAAIGRAGPMMQGPDAKVLFMDDLDAGLKHCEDALLAALFPDLAGDAPVPVTETLGTILADGDTVRRLAGYLERVEVAPSETLIAEGTPSSDIYFVEAGCAAVVLTAVGESIRLATMGPGSIVGEMAFYLGKERSASVVAVTPLVAWRLSADALARIEHELPEALIGLHRGMAAMLADRLAGANRLVRLLAD
jgi:sulfate permease, SulP family